MEVNILYLLRFIHIFIFQFLLFVSLISKADVPVHNLYNEKYTLKNIEIAYYVDFENTLTIEDAIKIDEHKFIETKENISLGFINAPIWIKLNIKNNNSKTLDWVLNCKYPLIDSLFLYRVNSNNTIDAPVVLGELIPTYKRHFDSKNIVFKITPEYNQTTTYFIKAKNSGPIFLPLEISSEETFLADNQNIFMYYGLFFGAICIVIVANIIFFLVLKEKIYLYALLHILSTVLVISYFLGFIPYYPIFEQNRETLPYILAFALFFSSLSNLLISKVFFDFKKLRKNFERATNYLIIFITGLLVISPFIKIRILLIAGLLSLQIAPMLLTYISLHAYKDKKIIARYFIINQALFSMSITFISLRLLGVKQINNIEENIAYFLLMISEIFLIISLADKFNILRNEYTQAQKLKFDVLAEKEKIIQHQNQILESKIEERTKEILKKNEELVSFTALIEQKNTLLKEYSTNLEEQIESRTKEILLANKKLEKKTERLEQFTYIVSHNLKSPINNLYSILNFINSEELSEDNKEYVEMMYKINGQLKQTIEDINILVKLDTELQIELHKVDLNKIINNALEKLFIQIKEANVTITKQINVIECNSFEPYLNSIIYNLLNNSIKYRKLDTDMKLHLSTYTEREWLYIKIEDNGIGIAENQINNIFKLFYRINKEREGKGMGLYIVKSQVEQLDGSIEVLSTVGEGTTFIIKLPYLNN